MKWVIVSAIVVILSLFSINCINLDKARMKNYPKVVDIYPFEVDAMLVSGCNMIAIKGTGSMQPLIPASKDPKSIVAWAVLEDSRDFNLLEAGNVVVFRHEGGEYVIHELVSLDKDGWISSGSNNSFYDSGRVTRENLRGVVILIYKLKQ